MAGRYDATKVSAAKAIKKSGVAMILNHKGTTAATNPWDPPTETTTAYPCNGVITNYQMNEIDGTVIKRDDRKVLLGADGLPVMPTNLDTLTIGGVEMLIMHVEPIAPSNDPIIYIVQVRNV